MPRNGAVIGRLQRQQCQPTAHRGFVHGVDVIRLPQVRQYHQPRIGFPPGHSGLGVPQDRPAVLPCAGSIHGQLHQQKGQPGIGILPVGAPAAHQAGQFRFVVPGPFLVLFPLIVPEPPQGIGADAAQHTFVQIARPLEAGATGGRRPRIQTALLVQHRPAHVRFHSTAGGNAGIPAVHLRLVGCAFGFERFVGLVPYPGIVPGQAATAFGEGGQLLPRQPAMGVGTAPETFQNAHMNMQGMGQFPGGVVGHRRKIGGGFRPYDLPPAGGSFGPCRRGDLGGLVKMQQFIMASGQHGFPVPRTGQGQFHIALPAGQPDFAKIHAGKGLGIRPALQHHGEGAARRLRGQREHPVPICLCHGPGRKPAGRQADGDHSTGHGGPPYGNRRFPLQHHVTAEHSSRLQLHFTSLLSGKQDFFQ